ncbi:hypothetical protein [Phenylobacterium sp.]|uniref:hypothetical protein n=1 Tax=Phenylobacterium sp. TaxID=1871053 RepID=UPI0035B424D2
MSNIRIGLLVDVFLVLGAIFALWKGGRAERAAAVVVLANVAVARIFGWMSPEISPLIWLCNDGVAALALLFITINFAAPWMGGVMLFFAAQFALHSYYLVNQRPFDFTTALVNNLNWTGITWCLIIGASLAWRRRLRARAAA